MRMARRLGALRDVSRGGTLERDNPDRDRWFDVLCAELLHLAGDKADVLCAYAPVGKRPNLGAAALISWICNQTSRTVTSAEIARRLPVVGDGSGHSLAEAIATVRLVRRNWLASGLPIADWWDTGQMLNTILAYLAPRVALEYGTDYAVEHLKRTFELSIDAYVDDLVATPVDPPALPTLPAAHTRASTPHHGAGNGLVYYLASLPATRDWLAERQAQSLLWSGDRATRGARPESADDGVDEWLRHGHAVVTVWKHIHAAVKGIEAHAGTPDVQALLAAYGPDGLAEAKSLTTGALRQCEAWLAGLTEAELTLIRVEDPVDLRRRRWLSGYMQIKQAWLLVPDSVPDATTSGEPLGVPTWVESVVFDRGARLMHDAAGPLAVWWGVVETDEDQIDLEASLDHPGRMAVDEDGDAVLIRLAVGPQQWHDAPLASFWFHPEQPDSAVELLLVAVAGLRLDWYRLRNERELQHLRAQAITIPDGALSSALERVDLTLARLEEEWPEVAPSLMIARSYMPPNQAEHMFVGADNAKSEHLLIDLNLVDAGPDDEGGFLVAMRAELAVAELARVSADADGLMNEQVEQRVSSARRAYHVARQKAGQSAHQAFLSLTADVVTPGRAFVQIVEDDDRLFATVAHSTEEGPTAILVESAVAPAHIRQVTDEWFGLAASRSWEYAADALDLVLDWIGTEVVQPVDRKSVV